MVKVYEDVFPKGTQGTKKPGYYMDGNLCNELDTIKKAIRDDWDMIFCVDGAEGSGKSVLTQQIAFYCDPSLDLNRIVFRPDTFKKAVLSAKQYQAVVYDEAYGGLSSKQTLSHTNKALVSMLTEIRQKNLFIFIVLPTFFDLDKYVALWRSRALFHVYPNKFERGRFECFNYNRKKQMYMMGKKFYNYKCVESNFFGSFPNFYVVDRDKYKAQKLSSLRSYDENEVTRQTTNQIQAETRREIVQYMYHQQTKMKLTKQDIADIVGIHRDTVYRMIKREEKT